MLKCGFPTATTTSAPQKQQLAENDDLTKVWDSVAKVDKKLWRQLMLVMMAKIAEEDDVSKPLRDVSVVEPPACSESASKKEEGIVACIPQSPVAPPPPPIGVEASVGDSSKEEKSVSTTQVDSERQSSVAETATTVTTTTTTTLLCSHCNKQQKEPQHVQVKSSASTATAAPVCVSSYSPTTAITTAPMKRLRHRNLRYNSNDVSFRDPKFIYKGRTFFSINLEGRVDSIKVHNAPCCWALFIDDEQIGSFRPSDFPIGYKEFPKHLVEKYNRKSNDNTGDGEDYLNFQNIYTAKIVLQFNVDPDLFKDMYLSYLVTDQIKGNSLGYTWWGHPK